MHPFNYGICYSLKLFEEIRQRAEGRRQRAEGRRQKA
jgi:hypothetical protein